jgi:hypothetical protein
MCIRRPAECSFGLEQKRMKMLFVPKTERFSRYSHLSITSDSDAIEEVPPGLQLDKSRG